MSYNNPFGDQRTVDEDSALSQCQTKQTDGKPVNALPSYTAMIAQAILSKSSQRSALSEIYEFMERRFPPLKEKGNGWRNCVRHTLSLSDCFLKLHRPENGRSCHWAIHPTYLPRFLRGDYRKRRQTRARRNAQNAPQEQQYPFQRMIYEREAMPYDSRLMQMSNGTGSIPEEGTDHAERHHRHHVPTCTAMISPYNQMPQGYGYMHSQRHEQPNMYYQPYVREYKPPSNSYPQYNHGHTGHSSQYQH